VVRICKYRGSAWSRRKRHGPRKSSCPWAMHQSSRTVKPVAVIIGLLLSFTSRTLFHFTPTTPSIHLHTPDRCSSTSPAYPTSKDRVDSTGSTAFLLFIFHGRTGVQEDALPGPPKAASTCRTARAAPSTVCTEAKSEGDREGRADRRVKVECHGK